MSKTLIRNVRTASKEEMAARDGAYELEEFQKNDPERPDVERLRAHRRERELQTGVREGRF